MYTELVAVPLEEHVSLVTLIDKDTEHAIRYILYYFLIMYLHL